jgi:hypothetical protein
MNKKLLIGCGIAIAVIVCMCIAVYMVLILSGPAIANVFSRVTSGLAP